MPLLKIWNLIRGQSSAGAEQSVGQQKSGGAGPQAAASAGKPSEAGKSGRATRRGRGARLSLFGGSGPHGSLCKLVKPISATTVLEITVGDGSRGIAVLQTLGDAQPVRYIAIDQFEMADGEVTLKSFHKKMRTAGISPQVFPEPIDRGLARVANTIGPVDLVIIAANPALWQSPETLSLLSRVTHHQTIVLYQDEENWDRYEQAPATEFRRAA